MILETIVAAGSVATVITTWTQQFRMYKKVQQVKSKAGAQNLSKIESYVLGSYKGHFKFVLTRLAFLSVVMLAGSGMLFSVVF